MVTKKSTSGKKTNRMTTKRKFVIKERVKQHNRKMQREAKKIRKSGLRTASTSKKNKDNIHIPNMFPFKKQLMEQIERRKENQDTKRQLDTLQNKTVASVNVGVVSQDQEAREQQYQAFLEKKEQMKAAGPARNFFKELRQVIDQSDIVLEVLDARDPQGCRCTQVEAEIVKSKKLILVLNKIDLVPLSVAYAWKKQLELEFPCVLFKGNTQEQNNHLQNNKLFEKSMAGNQQLVKSLLGSSKGVGADKLMEFIKNYSKHEGVKRAVQVGVVGFPNVGKSSLINSLKKKRAAGVSSVAGYTRSLQTFEIDSQVKIVDSPGVIMATEDESTLVLRNTINPKEVKYPRDAVEKVLTRVSKDKLLRHYKLAQYQNTTQFLINVALSRGKFKRGGAPNLEEAARMVLVDWAAGKLPYFVPPPGFNMKLVDDPEWVNETPDIEDELGIEFEKGTTDKKFTVVGNQVQEVKPGAMEEG